MRKVCKEMAGTDTRAEVIKEMGRTYAFARVVRAQ